MEVLCVIEWILGQANKAEKINKLEEI